MERHNGSKKKGWSQKGSEEGRTEEREKERRKKVSEKEIHPKASLTTQPERKPAPRRLSCFHHREYRALASSTIRFISSGYFIPLFSAAIANSLFASR